MSSIKFVLNKDGVRELLQSEAMQSILNDYAESASSRAGEGYNSEVHMGKKRAYANVYAETYEAKQDNLDNNTLLKSLH